MPTIPVDHDPFNDPVIPVDHDPFAPTPKAGQTVQPVDIGGSLAAARQRLPGIAANIAGEATGITDAMRAWRGEMTEEEARNFALMAAAGVVLPELKGARAALGAAEEAAPAIAKGIRAYHGSPHDFERFDISKIGTGEGAQAYGHGLYFAENPDTAAAYKRSTSDLKDWPIVGGDPSWRVPSWVGKTINSSPRGIDDMIADFSGRAAQMKAENHWNAGGIQDIVDALEAVKSGKAELKKPGHEYEVNINADPEHFLDWDKPLSEQHPKVQEKLATIVKDRDRPAAEWIKSSPGAEQRMYEAGIPGIKYLDQGSRGKAMQGLVVRPADGGGYQVQSTFDGSIHGTAATEMEARQLQEKLLNPPSTHNYVVFDDKLIDIIKKYGLAGLIAGGAAHLSTQSVDHDPFASQ